MSASKMETAVRRGQIAKAALDIVSSEGMNGLSIAAVAERVGLVPSAIYRHFAGREEMLDAVLDLILARLEEGVETVSAETGGAVECLRMLLMRHIGLIMASEGIPRIVFSEDLYESRPERKRKMYDGIRSYLEKIAGVIRRGREDGTIREDADPWTMAVMFLGLIQPSAVLWRLSDGEFDAARQAELAWPVFEREIRRGRR